jgi:ABC-2 type transport system permease protein
MTAIGATARDRERTRAGPVSGGLGDDLRAIKVVWHRELIAFGRNRVRVAVALMQPLLFLFVLGTGLSSVTRGTAGDISFRTFMFPGVLALAVLMPSFFAAGSIVFDREFGFLREMLVAPVRRGSIVVGKCLGGATVAGAQGAVLLCLARLAGVPYAPVMLVSLLALLVLLSFALVSFGVMAAAGISNFQSFMALGQLLIFPMLFLSGAMFPLSGLPGWLAVLTRIDPISYAVDPMRRAVFAQLDASGATRRVLDPGITWFGWRVPTALEVTFVALIGVLMMLLAVKRFERVE